MLLLLKVNLLESMLLPFSSYAFGTPLTLKSSHTLDTSTSTLIWSIRLISDLALSNVEALANGESGGDPCGGPKTYGECESRNTINCKDTSGCQ